MDTLSRLILDATIHRAIVLFALTINYSPQLVYGQGDLTSFSGAPKAGISIYRRREVSPRVPLGDF